MDGASALGSEQMTLRAFIFVGVGNEEKCIAAPRYRRGWNSRGRRRRDVPNRYGAHTARHLPFSGLYGQHQCRRRSSTSKRLSPRCRQPRYPHHEDHRQGRGITDPALKASRRGRS